MLGDIPVYLYLLCFFQNNYNLIKVWNTKTKSFSTLSWAKGKIYHISDICKGSGRILLEIFNFLFNGGEGQVSRHFSWKCLMPFSVWCCSRHLESCINRCHQAQKFFLLHMQIAVPDMNRDACHSTVAFVFQCFLESLGAGCSWNCIAGYFI